MSDNILKHTNHAPDLSYWKCDSYPYFIPAITSIKKIISPTPANIRTSSISDEFHCVLNGTATYEVIELKTGQSTFHTLKKNDIIFFSCGTQYYILHSASKDYEYLEISFYVYTYDVSVKSTVLNFSKILSSPIIHQRMLLRLPRVTHYHHGDEIHNCISIINKYRNFKESGYIIQSQTNLLQLIFFILSKSENNFNNILKNTNHMAISSKYSSFTSMPKGCKLSISDIKIRYTDSISKKEDSDILSVFLSHKNYKLTPDNNDLVLKSFFDDKLSENFVELTALEDTSYHIWLYPDEKFYTPDLRKYFKTGYLEFYAKSNIEIRFGVVLYNHNIHQFINHTVYITPSRTYNKYSIPLIGGENQTSQSPDVHKAINYIIQNYTQKIRIEDIANQIHMNPSYISTKFKNEIGISISDYLLNYRLSVAKKLLVTSQAISICDIALSSGFYDAAHFSKCFKKSFGMTAKQYRKQNISNN